MNSLKKGEGVPLLKKGEGVLLLNFEGGLGVPLLNFRGVLGHTFKLWGGSRVPSPRVPRSRVPASWSHFYTMPCENCAFPQKFHTKKLDEITVFYAVYLHFFWCCVSLQTSSFFQIIGLVLNLRESCYIKYPFISRLSCAISKQSKPLGNAPKVWNIL